VRVIDQDGQQLGIMPPEMALAKAMDLGLDLVEIAADSRPPVCRIMDYGKFKYGQKKKNSEAKRNQAVVTIKEVKFGFKIEAHDRNTKVENVRKFLSDGHKVKVTMRFRGREITRQDVAREKMQAIATDIKTVGNVESFPKVEGRAMIMVVAPLKT
jgi:translation initiation factor IF-3